MISFIFHHYYFANSIGGSKLFFCHILRDNDGVRIQKHGPASPWINGKEKMEKKFESTANISCDWTSLLRLISFVLLWNRINALISGTPAVNCGPWKYPV